MHNVTFALFVVTCLCVIQFSQGWLGSSGSRSVSRGSFGRSISTRRSFGRSISTRRSFGRSISTRRSFGRRVNIRRNVGRVVSKGKGKIWRQSRPTLLRAWQFAKKNKDYIKIGRKLLTGRFVGASLTASEKLAKWYMRKYPKTRTSQLLIRAKNIHDRNRIFRLLYKGTKNLFKRDLREQTERNRMKKLEIYRRTSENLYRRVWNTNNNQTASNKTTKEDYTPCQLTRLDVDINGKVAVKDSDVLLFMNTVLDKQELKDRIDKNDDGLSTPEEFRDFLIFFGNQIDGVKCQ